MILKFFILVKDCNELGIIHFFLHGHFIRGTFSVYFRLALVGLDTAVKLEIFPTLVKYYFKLWGVFWN